MARSFNILRDALRKNRTLISWEDPDENTFEILISRNTDPPELPNTVIEYNCNENRHAMLLTTDCDGRIKILSALMTHSIPYKEAWEYAHSLVKEGYLPVIGHCFKLDRPTVTVRF